MLGRLLPLTLAAFALVVAGARAAPYGDADYWAFADRVQAQFDPLWSAGMYRPGSGGVDVSVNANLLLTHAVAALAGHDGPARNDERARVLTARFLRAPTFRTRPVAGSRQAHAPGWSNGMYGGDDQHLV